MDKPAEVCADDGVTYCLQCLNDELTAAELLWTKWHNLSAPQRYDFMDEWPQSRDDYAQILAYESLGLVVGEDAVALAQVRARIDRNREMLEAMLGRSDLLPDAPATAHLDYVRRTHPTLNLT